jgi:PAS domain S-box-containing protein
MSLGSVVYLAAILLKWVLPVFQRIAAFCFASSGHGIDVLLLLSMALIGIADFERRKLSRAGRAADTGLRRGLEQQLRLQTTALEAAANAVAITDTEGKVVWVNSAFSALTGYSADEVLGKTPNVLKSGKHDAEFYEQLWRTIRSGQVWRGEITNRRKDGSLYIEEMTITPVQTVAGKITHFIAIKVDVSERKRAESELHRLNRALTTLSKCNEVLVQASNEDQLLNEVCKILVRSGGYRLAWVGYPERDENKSVCVIAKDGLDDGYLEKANISWADNERGCGPAGTAIRTGKTVVIRNILESPEFAPWRNDAVRRGYAAVAGFPLTFHSETIGALAICAPEADAFDAREVELLSELADDLAYGIVAIQNANDYAQAETLLHRRYRHCRYVGEWFQLDQHDLDKLLAIRQLDF